MINYGHSSMCLNFKRNFENKLHPSGQQEGGHEVVYHVQVEHYQEQF